MTETKYQISVQRTHDTYCKTVIRHTAPLLLLYRTQAKSQGIKQLMAGGGIVLIGLKLIPLLENVLK